MRNNKSFNLLALIALSFTTLLVDCQNKDIIPNTSGKNQPKIDIKVNKQYDDKGNVIGYDSTYSYIYSDSSSTPQNDSIFSQFHNFPHSQFHTFKNMPLNIDSLFGQNPFSNGFNFNDPFFNNNFNKDPFEDMNKILRKIDSLNRRNFNNINPPKQNLPKKPGSKPDPPKPEIQKPEQKDTTNVKIIEI